MKQNPECLKCLFFVREKNYNFGECRRFPPNQNNNQFPKVKIKEWCGEWKADTDVIAAT